MPESSKSDVDMSDEEEEVYEVEKLMAHRQSLKNKSKVEYLIKWKDYEPQYNSWEDEKNILSKALVQEYWNTQPYTLQSFRTNTHKTKGPNDSSLTPLKRKPTPSAVMLELEKKKKLTDVREAQITAEPPQELTWQDIHSVNNVFYSGKSTYFAEIRWTRADLVSYVPTRIIRKFNPLKLIYFYESNIDFYTNPVQSRKFNNNKKN